MKFNFDSNIISRQIPSGIILSLLCILTYRFVHIPLLPTNMQTLIGLVLLLDVLHLYGKIDIDISNLCQRQKSTRKVINEKFSKVAQIYVEEHFVFLVCFFASLFIGRLIVNLTRK